MAAGVAMEASRTNNNKRQQALRELLDLARKEALARVREFRKEQEEEATPLLSDELDTARSLADVETHASLIERAEYRLKAITAAFNHIEQGRYGVCEECGEEIPLARLQILPFAVCCVDCQTKRNRRLWAGEGYFDAPSRHLWSLPEEVDESFEKQGGGLGPEDQIMVHDTSPFGPEVEELDPMNPPPTARRRGRPKKREKEPLEIPPSGLRP
jgi:DnaK suppressor protein